MILHFHILVRNKFNAYSGFGHISIRCNYDKCRGDYMMELFSVSTTVHLEVKIVSDGIWNNTINVLVSVSNDGGRVAAMKTHQNERFLSELVGEEVM